MEEKKDRIAIINPDKCKPKKCALECKKRCPVNLGGKMCIDVGKTSIVANISETLCISCGICTKMCPFKAITMVNLPKGLAKDLTHRYNSNSFKLHRLPVPKPGQVLGLVGSNGVGKSTALKILSGHIKPNFGNFDTEVTTTDIINYFRGSELQQYFTKLYAGELVIAVKPQYVDIIPQSQKGLVQDLLKDTPVKIIECLELTNVLTRDIGDLSGGELQRFAIARTCSVVANVYIFDEPTSYLDIRQRIAVAKIIRSLCDEKTYVIVVEHDLSILDYLSDYVCCLYGVPAAYGVVTTPMNVREGINIFLDGFIPTENMRFRETSFTFNMQTIEDIDMAKCQHTYYKYPEMTKEYKNFKLNVKAGEFSDSEIIVMMGQNGTGKTSFIKLLAGIHEPTSIVGSEPINKFNISYKPQILTPKFQGTVRELFYEKIRDQYLDPQFNTDIIKPLNLESFIDNNVQELSGGEIQRVALALCLGKPADIYLIDEPSAYLDAEQRIIVSKIIKRFMMHQKKSAFIVEHDFIMATYLANRIIVFNGTPSVECTATSSKKLHTGINQFLEELDVTFRRDPTNYRPRINKPDSIKDKEQKLSKQYFHIENT